MDHGDQTCVYTWGCEVNAGHKGAELAPRVLEAFDGARVLQVRCSSNASLALTANGKVWWWGWMGGNMHSPSPIPVSFPLSLFVSFISITTPGAHDNQEHCACITDKHDLYMWGSNRVRQVTDGSVDFIPSPLFIMNNIKDVACGDSHTIVVQMNGDVICWGGSAYKRDEVILMGKKVRKVSAGAYGFCGALSEDNTLYTWAYSHGVSEGDFLGHGTRAWSMDPIPSPISSLINNCGWIHAGAVTLNGDLYTWGEGDTNRLGHVEKGKYKDRHKHVPTLVKGMEGSEIVRLSLSRGNEGAVTESGDVYTWGGDGHGGHHLHPTPTMLPLESTFFQGASIQDLACGRRHTVIVLRMQRSLQYLCLRAIVKHFDTLLDKIGLLPEEMREAIGSFMNDRRQLTAEKAKSISISLIPVAPPLPPDSPPTEFIEEYMTVFDPEDYEEDEDYEEMGELVVDDEEEEVEVEMDE